MSLVSIDDWQNFLNTVGGDFYDLVHGKDENNTEFTRIQYDNAVQYKGVYFVYNNGGSSYDYSIPCLVDFHLCQGIQNVVTFDRLCLNSNRRTQQSYDTSNTYDDIDLSIDCALSYLVTDNPYWIGSDNYVWMKNASDQWHNDIFKYTFNAVYHNSYNPVKQVIEEELNGQKLLLNNSKIDYYQNYQGFDDWFGNGDIPEFYNFSHISTYTAPSILNTSPVIINSNSINTNSSWVFNIKNSYVNNGDTITNYTYNIDNNNYITVNYSTDGDGVPTGYIDVQPTGNISFDDLFDMFNTILAPLVGVGLDLPDWTDYEPHYPIVTGDINVNIDIPDVTGEYPAETITPIDSDVYNIMSIDSLPQLPSLTGIDNGETAAALGSSFTFLDGCGLLMPFVTIAIIRLLISKFRGDS